MIQQRIHLVKYLSQVDQGPEETGVQGATRWALRPWLPTLCHSWRSSNRHVGGDVDDDDQGDINVDNLSPFLAANMIMSWWRTCGGSSAPTGKSSRMRSEREQERLVLPCQPNLQTHWCLMYKYVWKLLKCLAALQYCNKLVIVRSTQVRLGDAHAFF